MGRHSDFHRKRMSEIIRLDRHRRPETPSTKLGIIERHWNEARRGRLLPDRADIDPRAMTGALEHAFILERLARGLARFRLAGAHVNDLIGVEVRGLPVSAIFTPDGRKVLADVLQTVFDEPAVVRLILTSPGALGRPEIAGEMVLLPLRNDLGDVSRILGGLVMHGPEGRRPRRLEITGQTRQTLIGYAQGVPEMSKSVPDKIAPRRPVPRGMGQSEPLPHLRLVVDNT